MAQVVRLHQVAKRYPGHAAANPLKRVDLTVEVGDHVVITGPSGVGKSTLLNIIGLLDRPSSGDVLIDAEPVAEAGQATRGWLRANVIGFVFQNAHLLAHRSVIDNVELGLLYRDDEVRDRRQQALKALADVGMETHSQESARTLSGGEAQRVALARAIVGQRRLILCDEPTGNLDSATTQKVIDTLDQLRAGGLTLITSTHDPLVARAASRQFQLDNGRLHDVKQ